LTTIGCIVIRWVAGVGWRVFLSRTQQLGLQEVHQFGKRIEPAASWRAGHMLDYKRQPGC
jgi:hypothetical protein